MVLALIVTVTRPNNDTTGTMMAEMTDMTGMIWMAAMMTEESVNLGQYYCHTLDVMIE